MTKYKQSCNHAMYEDAPLALLTLFKLSFGISCKKPCFASERPSGYSFMRPSALLSVFFDSFGPPFFRSSVRLRFSTLALLIGSVCLVFRFYTQPFVRPSVCLSSPNDLSVSLCVE